MAYSGIGGTVPEEVRFGSSVPPRRRQRNIRAWNADQLAEVARGIPQILEIYNVAGDPDLLMHLRVGDREELAGVVNALRRSGKVAGTKTLIVQDSWTRT